MTEAQKAVELEIVRELCRRSLSTFVQEAWHVLEPGQPYVHGWHIDVLSEHLEAVERGEITRLLITIPPGCMKSLLTSVFFPMWIWGPCGKPWQRIISVSHEQTLAIRDNLKCRRLIQSSWYKSLWPEVELCGDQNSKLNFETTERGFRQATTTRSVTGRRGDVVVVDDPLSVQQASSDAELAAVGQWFREALPTRLNNPDRSAIVVIMQRLHEMDPAGIAIAEDLGYEHVRLPMRYEADNPCLTMLGKVDPRTKDGELLFPLRFPPQTVDALEKTMGPYAVAGQHQQRPVPRGGGMFQRDWFRIGVPERPVKRKFRAWDLAATDGGGDWTAGVLVGVEDKAPGDEFPRYWVLDVVRGQWAPHERDRIIHQTAQADGKTVKVVIEQEPGSAGVAQVESLVKRLAGYRSTTFKPTGPKAVRAEPVASMAGVGNLWLVPGEWNKAFLDELSVFPMGKHDDQVDALSCAFDHATLKASGFVVA